MIYCYFITGLQIRYQPKRFLLATDIFSSRELVAKSTRLDNVMRANELEITMR